MGERDYFISMEMARSAWEMLAEWGAPAVAQRLLMLTERISEGVRGIGVSVPEPHLRAPHILSLNLQGRDAGGGPIKGLASEGVYVAPPFGPHAYLTPRL
mgnify:CR=1 FL=1